MVLAINSYHDCQATTGWGKFDLNVRPPNRLEVRIKVFFEVSPLVHGLNIGTYLRDWQAKVSAAWDNKIRLRSGDPPHEELSVTFVLSRVQSLAACHFPVFIKDGGYAAGAGLYFPTPGFFGGTQMFLKLGQFDHLSYLQGSSANIQAGVGGSRAAMFVAETDRVMGELPGAQPLIGQSKFYDIAMDRVLNSWVVNAADRGLLDNVCAAIAATPASMPQPPVRISATSGAVGKSQDVVDRVAAYMRARGVVNPSIDLNPTKTHRKLRNPFRDPKATATATLEVLPTAEMIKRLGVGMAVADNVVSAHEFGHLLGLPDEYLDYSVHMNGNAIMVNSQPAWDILCGMHAPPVPTRPWHDAYNDSIMSVGNRVYAAHAVTLWQCLEAASGHPWSIVAP